MSPVPAAFLSGHSLGGCGATVHGSEGPPAPVVPQAQEERLAVAAAKVPMHREEAPVKNSSPKSKEKKRKKKANRRGAQGKRKGEGRPGACASERASGAWKGRPGETTLARSDAEQACRACRMRSIWSGMVPR